MGTRNLTVVIKDKKIKVAQYGQWDGYLSGACKYIKEFVQNKDNLDFLKAKIDKCEFVTQNKLDNLIKDDNVLIKFPQFGRDMGCDILDYIIKTGETEILLINHYNFAQDSLFCEYAYVIDLDNDILEIYLGFNENKNAEFGLFSDLERNLKESETYRTVALFRQYKFSKIPTIKYLETAETKFRKSILSYSLT